MDDAYDLRVILRVHGDADTQDVVVTCDDKEIYRHNSEGRSVTFIVDDDEYGLAGVAIKKTADDWAFCCRPMPAHINGDKSVMPITIELAEKGDGLCASFPMYSKTGRGYLIDDEAKLQVEFRSADMPRSTALN